ncbi:MAG TPA: DNA mismatch repair endonuclease MutL [Aggregatilineales bacterium]|nr:DNA mismatch repair endonuclease MutL [Aggregatilineales bacterium]
MSIQVLPEHVVAQIAAGEVVERPASVVKELIENALDAGARTIHVEVSGGGRRRIRISDDGVGIPPDEILLAFQRHATSKLRTTADLEHIATLGFRGEALASIASVSQLTMTSRHGSYEAGTLLHLNGGTLERQQAVGAPVGTVITVENLFFNTPARLKFLKKENTEKRQISLIITRYAMAYPQVRFVLEQDDREVFRSNGSGQLADVIVHSLGIESFRNMVEVESDETDRAPWTYIHGYTSVPSLHRADRNQITLFVNGRWIQDTRLSYAVTQAYHTFLMNGRYPVAVLMLRLPPQDVDVNVHPTKAEVRFRDTDSIFGAIQRGVRRAVVDLASTPSMRGARFGQILPYPPHSYETRNTQMDMGLPLETPGQYRRQSLYDQNASTNDPTEIPAGADAPARPRTLPILRAVGQVGAMYVVAEGPSGLYLIDQHAAHERVLFEQFMANFARQEPIKQYTLTAQSIHLPPIEARLLDEYAESLARLGFEIEPFGPNTYVIRSVPAVLGDASPGDVIADILADLSAERQPGQAAIEHKIITRVCKGAAIKAGQILSLNEMQDLIRQLERCESPHTCPHGRPTMLHLTNEQLAKEFGRLGA